MRAWLIAKAEEDKRRAEQERTMQENIRLEQRRTEHEMLRTSLNGGIPPPMVPIVFAGMAGGSLPQAALEWAHQFMFPHGPPLPPHLQQLSPQLQQQQQHQQHLIAASSPGLSELQRRSSQALPQPPHPPPPPSQAQQLQLQQQQLYGQPYGGGGGGPGAPGLAPGPVPSSGVQFATQSPVSPSRARGYSVPGPGNRPGMGGGASNLPTLNTNVAHPHGQQQPDSQASPLYIHHWQPPSSQGGSGSGQASTAPVPRDIALAVFVGTTVRDRLIERGGGGHPVSSLLSEDPHPTGGLSYGAGGDSERHRSPRSGHPTDDKGSTGGTNAGGNRDGKD
ncbi:hypothetical protein CMQ_4865 [Grosmannia clavigera kw1407]|uniref:Uncharacterized protein n=1 Tax=Grosmannia clavigera (strain kw1407 / UAMH 11150) TaxID=655863 RepID=F0XTJ3_GROCL|nr:uncharacterized protein CMQ_4865 [Grosmannia clavigera kw1407]EFW99013.1 hypothetical protein CMQ_4865 [Grosmannia clavigera kw1407]